MFGLPVPKRNNEEDEARGLHLHLEVFTHDQLAFPKSSFATTVVETMRFRKGSFSTRLLKFKTEWQSC